MPPDTASEKTEAPTPRRLQEAREKGQVARSQDLSAAVGLLTGMILLNVYGPTIMYGFMELMRQFLDVNNIPAGPAAMLDENWRIIVRHAWSIIGPFFLVIMAVALVVNVVQVGFLFAAHPLVPSLEKISPLGGLRRLFSLRSLIKLVMNLFKVGIISVVAYITIKGFMPQLVGSSRLGFQQVIGYGAHLVFVLSLRLSLVLLILALCDYAFQKWKMYQDLRMTKEEVKEELRRMEGDPIMRQRRRGVARQLAAQRMSRAVPKADVVITNPTELAVALKYVPQEMPAPRVVARGAGFIAQRIREIALENNVPVIQRKPLAQALYKSCEVGDFVPPDLYKAVAEVLAYVFELAGKGFQRSIA